MDYTSYRDFWVVMRRRHGNVIGEMRCLGHDRDLWGSEESEEKEAFELLGRLEIWSFHRNVGEQEIDCRWLDQSSARAPTQFLHKNETFPPRLPGWA